MKILLTGAHFTPAQAVIDELKKQPNIEIIYIGRKTTQEGDKTPSVESQLLPELGVKFYPIIAGRLRRHAPDINSLVSIFKIPIGFIQSFFVVLKEQPDVTLSFGGYVAVPVVISSWLLNIPIIIHEQTLVSGLANKITSFFATKIAVSFEKEYDFPKEKIVLTGNPIRKELLTDSKIDEKKEVTTLIKLAKKEKLPIIYITGGNQGSHIINETVLEALEELTKIVFIIHQTGDSKFKDFEKLLEKQNDLKNEERYLVQKWFNVEEVKWIFKNSDLVISRAGANTLYELSYFGVPTLVIPLPYLYKNEQEVNANYFNKLGLCQIILQKNLDKEKLLEKIKEIVKNLNTLKKEAAKAKLLVIKDAAKRLALETILLKKEI